MKKISFQIKKEDLPKDRIPVAPPSIRHKSKRDYNRKRDKQQLKKQYD